jgi:hypothetical protein
VEVQSRKSEFDRRGIAIVVVSFAEPANLIPYQEYHRWPFTILADPERVAYQEFALKRLSWFQVFSPTTLKLYWKLLRQGMKRTGYGKEDIYQSGRFFIGSGREYFVRAPQPVSFRPATCGALAASYR